MTEDVRRRLEASPIPIGPESPYFDAGMWVVVHKHRGTLMATKEGEPFPATARSLRGALHGGTRMAFTSRGAALAASALSGPPWDRVVPLVTLTPNAKMVVVDQALSRGFYTDTELDFAGWCELFGTETSLRSGPRLLARALDGYPTALQIKEHHAIDSLVERTIGILRSSPDIHILGTQASLMEVSTHMTVRAQFRANVDPLGVNGALRRGDIVRGWMVDSSARELELSITSPSRIKQGPVFVLSSNLEELGSFRVKAMRWDPRQGRIVLVLARPTSRSRALTSGVENSGREGVYIINQPRTFPIRFHESPWSPDNASRPRFDIPSYIGVSI